MSMFSTSIFKDAEHTKRIMNGLNENGFMRAPESEKLFRISLAVSRSYGLKLNQIKIKTRKRSIVEARQVAMYLAKKETDLSLSKIGLYFRKKDHATVHHAHKAISNLITTNQEIRNRVTAAYEELIKEPETFQSLTQ